MSLFVRESLVSSVFSTLACESKLFLIVGNNLQGTLPDELRLLTRLSALDTSLNAIEGSIPSTISELSNLRVFRCNNARLSGNLPENLGRATALREFDVRVIFKIV